MFGENNKQLTIVLDPRTEILLLVIANIVAFSDKNLYIEISLITYLGLILLLCKCYKSAVKWSVVFVCLLLIQYYVLPVMPQLLAVLLAILSIYLRKLLPCLMVGALILATTPVRYLIIALRRWKVPQGMIIPLSITLRYFPAIKEEYQHIREAMKLRKVSGIAKKIEYIVVPLLVSATSTADELSAAAITRGIENPCPKTCIVDLKLHVWDYLCLTVGGILLIAVILT